MKYITAMFVFLVFNASWQWWAIMCALMLVECFMLIGKFREEYKKQIKEIEKRPITKEQLEEVWNNGYKVGTEHASLRKH